MPINGGGPAVMEEEEGAVAAGADAAIESRSNAVAEEGGDGSAADATMAVANADGGSAASGGGAKRQRTCIHFLKGRCRYGESCLYSHDAEPYAQRPAKQKKTSQQQQQQAEAKRPTLLQALLAKEIRAERSLLLQCVRRLVSVLDEEQKQQ